MIKALCFHQGVINTINANKNIKKWFLPECATLAKIQEYVAHCIEIIDFEISDIVQACAFYSTKGHYLALLMRDNHIKIYNLITKQWLDAINSDHKAIRTLSPRENQGLIVQYADGTSQEYYDQRETVSVEELTNLLQSVKTGQ